MKRILGSALAAIFILGTSGFAAADPKPKGAKPSDSQEVANFYAGTTRMWQSCNGGGIYFDSGWEAKAYCNKNAPSVGWGKWSVKNGTLCHEIVWRWMADGELKTQNGDKGCIAHVTDADGQMWRKWDSDKDWWRVQPIKSDKKAFKGFKLKGKFNRTKRKNGV